MIEDRAIDDQRDQSRDKGSQAEITDQNAVDRAEEAAT